MENKLTLVDMVEKDPHELVLKQTPEQRMQTYIALDIINKALKEEERQAILNDNIDKFEWQLPNGVIKTLTVVKTNGRTEDVVVKKINWDEVIKFAKENEYVIPMTQPQIDTEKLETLEWFQNNVDKFIVKTIETKTVKPTKAIKVK